MSSSSSLSILSKKDDPDYILNPETKRYVKKYGAIGKKIMKELNATPSTPIIPSIPAISSTKSMAPLTIPISTVVSKSSNTVESETINPILAVPSVSSRYEAKPPKVLDERERNLVNYALEAHELGFVPIPLRDKIPVIKEWQNQRNNPVEDEISIAKGELPKNVRRIEHLLEVGIANNLGIVTGEASGIVVFDVDVQNNGLEKWEELIKNNTPIPETFTVRTGSGGKHYYFKYTPDLANLKNRNKMLGYPIDFRTNGGQIIFPGSINMKTGKEYLVESGYYNGEIVLAELPLWLKNMVITDQIAKSKK